MKRKSRTVDPFMPRKAAKRDLSLRRRQPERFERYSDLPKELKALIVENLLVSPSPIVFNMTGAVILNADGTHPGIARLCAAFLRADREMTKMSIKTLYSKNTFAFREMNQELQVPNQAFNISVFLEHIGSNTKYIRHVEIPFPALYPIKTDYHNLSPGCGGADGKTLEVLLRACTELTTLTLKFSWVKVARAARQEMGFLDQAVDLLNQHLRASESLTTIIVDVGTLDNIDNDVSCRLRPDLEAKMVNSGWIVQQPRQGT